MNSICAWNTINTCTEDTSAAVNDDYGVPNCYFHHLLTHRDDHAHQDIYDELGRECDMKRSMPEVVQKSNRTNNSERKANNKEVDYNDTMDSHYRTTKKNK
eukprot:266903_1